jgi:hypothetical protein
MAVNIYYKNNTFQAIITPKARYHDSLRIMHYPSPVHCAKIRYLEISARHCNLGPTLKDTLLSGSSGWRFLLQPMPLVTDAHPSYADRIVARKAAPQAVFPHLRSLKMHLQITDLVFSDFYHLPNTVFLGKLLAWLEGTTCCFQAEQVEVSGDGIGGYFARDLALLEERIKLMATKEV